MGDKTYRVGGYHRFMIYDPKERKIEALSFRDRVVQHCLCDNILKPYFENRLIYDNAACREGKGTDFARDRLSGFLREHYKKHGARGYILKYDIRHYFDSIDHEILKGMLRSIPDRNVLGLLKCMESSMRQCIGQRNPVPFLRRHPREKHMLSETLDARAFKALGVGDAPYSPGSQLEEDEYKEVMTDETENETVDGHPAHPRAGAGLDVGDEPDGVCGRSV